MAELPVSSKIPHLETLIDTVTTAGDKIVEVYKSNFQVGKKDDNSPITKADLESNRIIKEYLLQTGIPILSEEDLSLIHISEPTRQAVAWTLKPELTTNS